jgi:hypothetical protein
VSDEAASTEGQTFDELGWTLDSALERLVKELLHALRDAESKAERISNNV